MPTPRTLALLGNAVALTLVCLLCGAGDVLFADADPAPVRASTPARASAGGAPLPSGSPAIEPVLLVVVDGLRLDVSLDRSVMPELAALAGGGRRTVLTVEALVPSTIAALQAMVEGRRVAPTAALHDFGAPASPGGGTLERLDAAGGRIVVAATHLWDGLYGRFLSPGLAVPGLPDRVSDARVFRVAMRALGAPDAPEDAPALVVAHFGALDAAGHRHGGASDAYRDVAAGIDALAGRLVRQALAQGRAVVFSSDHGTTDAGGHAGGEPSVRRVPLVVAGRDLPALLDALDPTWQRELPALLDAALGLSPVPVPGPRGPQAGSPSPTTTGIVARWLAVIAACLAGLVVAATRGALVANARASTALSASVWVAIALAALIRPAAGAAFATLALAAVAIAGVRGVRDADRPRTLGAGVGTDVGTDVGAAAACGAAFAAWSVADATHGAAVAGPALAVTGAGIALVACRPAPGPGAGPGRATWTLVALAALGSGVALGGPALAALAGLALAGGALTGRAARPVAAGVALALVPAALARVAGDTASLSSIDVALAHRMAESSLGLGAAVATAVARLALLPVAAMIGHALARGLHCPAPDGNPRAGAFDALAATQIGAGLAFAGALVVGAASPDPLAGVATGIDAASAAGVPPAAAGLGGLLRELDAAVWLWLAAAAAIGVGRLARVDRARGRDAAGVR